TVTPGINGSSVNALTTVISDVALCACVSGLKIVTSFGPGAAPTVEMLSVTVVGFTNVAELTMTPPLTAAVRRLGKPAPGSKNAEPELEVPVIVTSVDAAPRATDEGLADAGVTGGGAISFITRTPHEFTASVYSWNVHSV